MYGVQSFFFFKQKTAYEFGLGLEFDVCSSDLAGVELARRPPRLAERIRHDLFGVGPLPRDRDRQRAQRGAVTIVQLAQRAVVARRHALHKRADRLAGHRLELVLTRGGPQRTLESYGEQNGPARVYL